MNNLDPKGAIGTTKTPLHLLPPAAMEAWAWAQKDGADRYGPYNWRSVQVCATTYISAMMRHLDAFRDGEDRTKDSKVFHLGAIMANCAILLDAAAAGTLVDDRFKMPESKDDHVCCFHRDMTGKCFECGSIDADHDVDCHDSDQCMIHRSPEDGCSCCCDASSMLEGGNK